MKSTYSVQFRRKRKGKTNYNKRLKLIMSNKPRLVIRKSNKNIIAQVVSYSQEGDKILAAAYSKELKKMGWALSAKNICAAYLTGLMLGKRAKKKGIKEAVLDIGFNSSVKGSRVYSALKGFTEFVPVPCSTDIFPNQKMLSGEQIANYFELLKKKETNSNQFSNYVKENIDVKSIAQEIERVKQKIIEQK
jgi:large subunit ribosomal protein L18